MNAEESTLLMDVMRAAWPDAYLPPEREQVWALLLENHDFQVMVEVVREAAQRQTKVPSFAVLHEVYEEKQARRFTCPRCGVGKKSMEAVADHLSVVHGIRA